ncbi:hypothetical protein BH09GEM1_BH09GEM1_29450 [soil metagenome]
MTWTQRVEGAFFTLRETGIAAIGILTCVHACVAAAKTLGVDIPGLQADVQGA